MSQLDDAQLAEQLARRAAGAVSATELARGIEQLTARASQERPRAWERWLPIPAPGRRRLAFPALSAALGLVVLLAAANLVGAPSGRVQPTPQSTTVSTWLLDLGQLQTVLDRVAEDGTDLGKVVVAEVSIVPGVAIACPHAVESYAPAPDCVTSYRIGSGASAISVIGVPPNVPCPSGAGRCALDVEPGPYALRLLTGRAVEYISPVLLHDGRDVPFSVDEFIDSTSTQPMVVEGWLSGIPPLPCPQSNVGQANGFECGPAAWITSEPFDPNVTPAPSSNDGFGFEGPARGIRVENGASTMIPTGFGASPSALERAPTHALYLVNRLAIDPATCFLCSSATAFVAAEVEPAAVEAAINETEPPASAPSPAVTSPPTEGPDGFWSGAQLEAAVRAAQASGTGVGRVVVADVAFEAREACATQPLSADCSVVVTGSDPPITLRDAQAECPSGFYCALVRVPIVPHDGPFALRILGDGSVSFVGYVDPPVVTSVPVSSTWLFDFLRDQLATATGSQLSDYRLVVVSGWISGAAGEPRCLVRSVPDPRFGCGQASWLTAAQVQPNTFSANEYSLRAPTQSIRLPNGAYAAFAPSPTPPGPRVVPETEHGTFLVRAIVPPLSSCFLCDGPSVEVVARLDP